ncbi:MAG: LemA family protein [Victivallales bacterium]|nr:LemA family protein [Victivallales bacterium]
MANELDELNATVNPAGRDVNVIEKQLKVTTTGAETFFCVYLPWLLFIIPGLILWFMRMSARNYFLKLQQKLQAEASQIDNYLEQRVVILQNVAALVNKAVDLDKDVMKTVAAFRGGVNISDENRNAIAEQLNGGFARLFPQVEAYPELKAHAAIADAMQQNSYLQKEITAARGLYNDTVMQWNSCIYELPARKIVAAANGYTTRIPFTASAEVKAQARGVFF